MAAAPSGHLDAAATTPEAARLMWWRQDLHAPHIVGDTIYGSFCSDGDSGWLAAVDRLTGADLWIVPIEGEVIGVTAEIIVARHDDRVFGLTIATRQEAGVLRQIVSASARCSSERRCSFPVRMAASRRWTRPRAPPEAAPALRIFPSMAASTA